MEFFRTPGHRKISGNEIVDDLACLGEEEHIVGPVAAGKIPDSRIKENFRVWNEKNNMEAWMANGSKQAKAYVRE